MNPSSRRCLIDHLCLCFRLKRKLSQDFPEPSYKKIALSTVPGLMPCSRVMPQTMDPSYYQGFPAEEDFMSGDMFTSQAPQDFTLPVTATTALSMESMTAFDTLSMNSGLGWSDHQEHFVPALTPSRESDFSSPSSENLTWLDSTSAAQEAMNFEIHQAMLPQGAGAYPMKNQWPNVSMDSPAPSLHSTYDDQESQVSLLDVGQSAYDVAVSSFDAPAYVTPVSMVNPVVMDPTYSPMMEPFAGQLPLDSAGRRLSNESGPREARSDPRYKQRPEADGFYHCPFPDCDHEPDKLKCNYDKHLDAHLRPYRCTRDACRSIQFSSTACVLRHEREAHGMHGHGHKPFVCRFADCERANPENGFPRKWNLKDHMKRVHHFDEEAAAKSAASPLTPPESPSLHMPGPQRIKRGNRASPKPRSSKDDTIKASSFRRPSRMPVSQAWVSMPEMHQNLKYEQPWDGSAVQSAYPPQWL